MCEGSPASEQLLLLAARRRRAVGVRHRESAPPAAGRQRAAGPRHELFVYVHDVDATLAELRDAGVMILREPADMPWGERVAFVRDPEDNVVTLATAAG